MAGFLTIHPVRSYAQLCCEVSINIEAIPSDDTVFTFDVTGAIDTTGFDQISGNGKGLAILAGNTADIVEEVRDGWVLDNVECDTNGVTATNNEY